VGRTTIANMAWLVMVEGIIAPPGPTFFSVEQEYQRRRTCVTATGGCISCHKAIKFKAIGR